MFLSRSNMSVWSEIKDNYFNLLISIKRNCKTSMIKRCYKKSYMTHIDKKCNTFLGLSRMFAITLFKHIT